MKCRRVQALASAYLDGVLGRSQSDQMRAHLDQCPRCADIVNQLRMLISEAGRLEDHYPPPGLFDRAFAASQAGTSSNLPKRKFVRRLTWSAVPVLAAAAAWVILVLWPHAPPSPRESSPSVPTPEGEYSVREGALMDSVAREFRRAEEHYQRAIRKLRAMAAEDSKSWPKEQRQAYERSLQIIDKAVERCRRSVRKYPADPRSREVLFAAYRRQVQFLQDTILTEADLSAPVLPSSWSP